MAIFSQRNQVIFFFFVTYHVFTTTLRPATWLRIHIHASGDSLSASQSGSLKLVMRKPQIIYPRTLRDHLGTSGDYGVACALTSATPETSGAYGDFQPYRSGFFFLCHPAQTVCVKGCVCTHMCKVAPMNTEAFKLAWLSSDPVPMGYNLTRSLLVATDQLAFRDGLSAWPAGVAGVHDLGQLEGNAHLHLKIFYSSMDWGMPVVPSGLKGHRQARPWVETDHL